MPLTSLRRAALAALAVSVSCTDVTAPRRSLTTGPARPDIDVSVAVVALDLLYNGQSIGPSVGPPTAGAIQGDRCFNLTLDGQFRANACGAMNVNDLPPGSHTIGLQDYNPSGPPPGSFVDIQPPVSVDLVGGQSTPLTFDISSVRGEVTGVVRINGQAPADFQYQICVEGGGCGSLIGGAFTLLARPGAGKVYLQSMSNLTRLVDVPYTVVAGQTTDVGTMNVQFATVALDIVYAGQSIGSSFGPPVAGALQGDRCFNLTVDGVFRSNVCGAAQLSDLVPGAHTIGLQQTVPTGPPPGSFADVQPPIAVTLVGGQSTPVTFDITGVRGKITGSVRINGAPPPDFQYQVCVQGAGCGSLIGGAFALLARPGSGTVQVQSMQSLANVATAAFTAVAGQTTDLGAITVQSATIALDIVYNGQSIGPSSGPPTASSPQGDHCFNLTVDGQSRTNVCGAMDVPNLPTGVHTIGLQQFSPNGPPPGFYTDVQPPVSVTLVGGQSTPVTFDISAARGKISGVVRINGQAPPDFQYQVCTIDVGGCGNLIGGQFTLFTRLGAGSAKLQNMMQLTTLANFSYIVAAGKTTLIGGVSTAAPGSTPAGTAVTVQPVNQTDGSSNATVGLTFANVSTSGTTTVVQSATGSPLPTGLQLGSPPVFFDISTTAAFTGSVDVCINYTGTTFSDPSQARLLHGDGAGNWTDVTTSHDQVNRIICGSVTSFSPFVVAQRTAPPPPPPQKPTVTAVVTGTQGSGGWYVNDVSVTWAVVDHGTPVTSSTGCGPTQITANTTGTTLSCTATSAGGTGSASVTIMRDASTPTPNVSIAGTAGSNGWYVSDVGISATATGAGPSGAAATCTPTAVTADASAVRYSCVATSGAGLSSARSGAISRDATKPVITLAGNAGTYTVDQTVAITCSATDATSGIATSTCANVNAPAYTFSLGANAITAQATDVAGNVASAQAQFAVALTGPSFAALISQLVQDAKTRKDLLDRLSNILDKRDKGNTQAMSEQVKNFIKTVDKATQDGVITASAAAVLTRLVQQF